MSEEMNRVSHALCAPDYALLVPSLPARGFFLLSESSTVLRAFSTRWTTPAELRNTSALATMRVIIAPCSSPVRLFAPRTRLVGRSRRPSGVAASFSFEGRVTSETSEARSKHAGAGGHAGTYPPIVRFTERGIHGAGDEPHCPIPLITGLEYKAAPDGAVHLPPPDIRGHDSHPFEWVVAERRCCRDFAELPSGHLHLWEIAQLSWAAQGITAPETAPDEFGHAG